VSRYNRRCEIYSRQYPNFEAGADIPEIRRRAIYAYSVSESLDPTLTCLQLPEDPQGQQFKERITRQDLEDLREVEKMVQESLHSPARFRLYQSMQLHLHCCIEQAELNFLEYGFSGAGTKALESPWWMSYIRGTLDIPGWLSSRG